jgi:phenylpropionate dioxygenase-like ring-hydroxylating dioxygenase large terminal subunit
MDTLVAETSRTAVGDKPGYFQSWFPLCLASEVGADSLIGVDILGSRVIVYRDATGKVVVQSAWCPHLGADLSQGQRIEGQVRCPYHHWRFDTSGACTHIPTGDRIPAAARIFTYPSAEAWGLVWLFNGEKPLFGVPRIPDAVEAELDLEAHFRGVRRSSGEVALSNGIDFQHLRTLHGLQTTEPREIEVRDFDIEFKVDNAGYTQHGLITGMSTFAQHITPAGQEMFMLFCGGPIDRTQRRSFFVIGVPKGADSPAVRAANKAKLAGIKEFVERLLSEDEPVLDAMRFRRGVLVQSDRYLSRYFKYVNDFPRAEPPGG